jgi:hypothetical protein
MVAVPAVPRNDVCCFYRKQGEVDKVATWVISNLTYYLQNPVGTNTSRLVDVIWRCIVVQWQLLGGVPCLGRLVAGLSPRRAGFNPRAVHVGFVVDVVGLGQIFIRMAGFSRRTVHVGFVVDRMEWWQVFILVLQFTLSVSFHQSGHYQRYLSNQVTVLYCLDRENTKVRDATRLCCCPFVTVCAWEQLSAGTDLYLILAMSVAGGSRSNERADSLFTSRLGSQ